MWWYVVDRFTTKEFPSNCFISLGLSLYFEDGHDDLDDCEFSCCFFFPVVCLPKVIVHRLKFFDA